MRRRALSIALLAGFALLACNQIFGIDSGDLVEPSDAGSDASNDGAISDAGSDSPTSSEAGFPDAAPYWLFTSTDFNSHTEVSLLTPGTPATSIGSFNLSTGDALAYASNGRAFIIDQAAGDVYLLDRDSPQTLAAIKEIHTSIGLDGGSEPSNPYAVVMVSETKGYIVRYDSNELMVVDVTKTNASGIFTAQSVIDLTAFAGSAGLARMVDGAFNPATNTAYIALERIDTHTLSCTDDALLVPINAATDQVVDRNTSGTVDVGDAIPLVGRNPSNIVSDLANNRLLVVNQGCNEGDGGARGADIDIVDLGASTVDAGVAVSVTAADLGATDIALLYANTMTAFVFDHSWTKASFIPPWVPFVDVSGTTVIGISNDKTPDGGTNWGVYSVQTSGGLSVEAFKNVFSTVNNPNGFSLSAVLVH
jgi:hypothetical protein